MTTQSASFTLPFHPELARSLKELGVPHTCEATLFLQQLAFWLKTNSGHYTDDGIKWIYNSYRDWTETQITSLAPHQFGRMVRYLRGLGVITTSTFAGLKRRLREIPPVAWHEWNTTTWWTICPERIFELTGWHPFGENKKPSPQERSQSESQNLESLEPSQETDVQICTTGNSDLNRLLYKSEFSSIYIKNHISHQNGATENKEKRGEQQDEGSYPSATLPQDGSLAAEDKPKTHANKQASNEGQFSGAGSKVQNSRNFQESERPPEIWEAISGKPFNAFVNWWAERHYKPQGGKWETGALGYAYSEFYRNPQRTTEVIFPQFLEEVRSITERVNQAQNSGVESANVLPSWFIPRLPEATPENVRQLMENLETVIKGGVRVAVPNKANTPSSQTVSYQVVEEMAQIEPLPVLEQPTLLPKMCEVEASEDLAAQVQRKQLIWETAPVLRSKVQEWVEKTPGVVLTANGVMLEVESVDCELQVKTPPTEEEVVTTRRDFKPGEGFGGNDNASTANDSSTVLTSDPWESNPVEVGVSPTPNNVLSAPKANPTAWALSLRPGQWVRFKNENGFWYKGQVVRLYQEQGYFIKVDIRYWAYGKTRHESIFRDDWLEPFD